jgi:hypothetical protein
MYFGDRSIADIPPSALEDVPKRIDGSSCDAKLSAEGDDNLCYEDFMTEEFANNDTRSSNGSSINLFSLCMTEIISQTGLR